MFRVSHKLNYCSTIYLSSSMVLAFKFRILPKKNGILIYSTLKCWQHVKN